MTLEINNISNIHRRTSSIILLFMFLIILILDVTITHIIFSAKWDWFLYVLIFFGAVLSIVLYREKYVFLEITQDILCIKQCSYLNFKKKPVIELPISDIQHTKLEKVFFFSYLKIVITEGDRKKLIRYHLKGFGNREITRIEEFFIRMKK